MDDKKEKLNNYNQDLALEKQSFSNKIYNYFYIMLSDKKEISFLEIYILYILETIQLISYGISEPHINTWKENKSILKTISDIIGISRITTLMKYVKFDIYLIIFFCCNFYLLFLYYFSDANFIFQNRIKIFFDISLYNKKFNLSFIYIFIYTNNRISFITFEMQFRI